MWEYNYLQHEGTKGQKWYHRLYQNPDGTYTPLGLARKRAQYQASKRQEARESRRQGREEHRNAMRNPRRMTSSELKTATARLKAENEYNTARNAQRRTTNWIRSSLENAGKNSLNTFATTMTTKMTAELARRAIERWNAGNVTVSTGSTATDISDISNIIHPSSINGMSPDESGPAETLSGFFNMSGNAYQTAFNPSVPLLEDFSLRS